MKNRTCCATSLAALEATCEHWCGHVWTALAGFLTLHPCLGVVLLSHSSNASGFTSERRKGAGCGLEQSTGMGTGKLAIVEHNQGVVLKHIGPFTRCSLDLSHQASLSTICAVNGIASGRSIWSQ